MIRKLPGGWPLFLSQVLEQLVGSAPLRFSEMKPSLLPSSAGVYLITNLTGGEEIPWYVGRTTNIRRRLYSNHLMGPLTNARLKKYLIDDRACGSKDEAKRIIAACCAARWVEEPDYRKRGAIEGYCTAMLFPTYGIEQEH